MMRWEQRRKAAWAGKSPVSPNYLLRPTVDPRERLDCNNHSHRISQAKLIRSKALQTFRCNIMHESTGHSCQSLRKGATNPKFDPWGLSPNSRAFLQLRSKSDNCYGHRRRRSFESLEATVERYSLHSSEKGNPSIQRKNNESEMPPFAQSFHSWSMEIINRQLWNSCSD